VKQAFELKNLVQDILNEAKKQGATAAEVALSIGDGLSVTARLGAVETLEYDSNQGLGITVYVGQKKGSASSSDISLTSIKETIASACSIAKFSNEDKFSGLPEKNHLATEFPDLDLYYPWNLAAEDAIDLAISCEATALDFDPEIHNSEGATVNSHQGISIFGNSLGFLQAKQKTQHSLSCAVIAKRAEEMQRDYWYSVARDAQDLDSAALVGKKTAELTLARLGAQNLSTRTAPVLYSPQMASSLLSSLMGAISGGSLYRKASFLLDSLDTQILPEFMRIYEDPYLQKALGSAAFDAEGVQTQNTDIVSNGILKRYLLSSYSARKLGFQTTGNASGVHNLTVATSANDFKAMLKLLDTGLLVTELMGQGVNPLTGDYSRGAAGFWVENGQIQYPVEEITIAGNLTSMLKNLVAVGNDVDYQRNIRTGSILLESMSIAGQ